jgi:hypothetical protein
MSFELRMIIIYTIIFVIIGLFIWLYITTKNKREDEKITRDIDFSNDNDDPEDDSLSDYDEYVHHVLGSSRKDDYLTDEIDDFINNFTYRESDFENVIEQSMKESENNEDTEVESISDDYTISELPVNVNNDIAEVVNILIGNKSYIFLANGNKLNNGERIILSIEDRNYPGVVVKSNYDRDLSTLKILPKPLIIVKKIN